LQELVSSWVVLINRGSGLINHPKITIKYFIKLAQNSTAKQRITKQNFLLVYAEFVYVKGSLGPKRC
jgi:hypothetical protein